MGDPSVQAGLLQEERRARMEMWEVRHDSKHSPIQSMVLLEVPL